MSGCSIFPTAPCYVVTPYLDTFTGRRGRTNEDAYSVERIIFTVDNGANQILIDSYSVPHSRTNHVIEEYAVWSLASVAAVPEPATYAMLFVGLGLLGVVKRSKHFSLYS